MSVEPWHDARELIPATPNDEAARLMRWAQAAEAAHGLAKALVHTSFVPKQYQGANAVGDATAAILFGAEVGLSPVTALQSIYVVHGSPEMYARAMVALALAHGHEIWTESESDTAVTVCGRRAGSDFIERVEWTIKRAERAGYAAGPKSNPLYRSQPRVMLWARAASDVARRVAADVMAGIPEPTDPEPGAQQTPGVVSVAPKRSRAAFPGPNVANPGDARADEPGPADDARPAPDDDGQADEPEPDDGPPDVDPATGERRVTDAVTDLSDYREAADADADEPAPDEADTLMLTGAQRSRIMAEFRAAGMDRPRYLAWMGQVLEREVPSTNSLSIREASEIIERIEAVKAGRRDGPADEGA